MSVIRKGSRVHYRVAGSGYAQKATVINKFPREGLGPYYRILLDGASRITVAWPNELKRLRPAKRAYRKHIIQLRNQIVQLGSRLDDITTALIEYGIFPDSSQ